MQSLPSRVSPSGLRLIYGYYSEPVLWCGLNMKAQTIGSKGVMGDAASLLVLGDCLHRLLLYHIDQTYKALRSPFFGLVQRKKGIIYVLVIFDIEVNVVIHPQVRRCRCLLRIIHPIQ